MGAKTFNARLWQYNPADSDWERVEDLAKNTLAYKGTCDSGMASSTTSIVSADLAGYGNDYFNTKYYMQIIKNANSVGNAPEREVQQITDYVSSSGTFTTGAFSANVQENDEILILHESIVMLGRDDANNAMATTNVVANADGSLPERLQFIQDNLIPDLSGLVFSGTCDAGMTASTTTVVCGDLSGYGDDFFNDKYFMQIIKNANSVGNAPEPEVRLIDDYTSASGTFTVSAVFSANVEENDEIMVIHESLVMLGRNDADNTMDTSNVVANADGSIPERLETIQQNIGVPLTKTITTPNVGQTDIFTVTGDVTVKIIAVCTTTLSDATNTATASVGTAADVDAMIPVTGVTDGGAGQLTAREIWYDNAPDSEVEALDTIREYIVTDGNDITIDVLNENITGGVIVFYCTWTPLSAGATVVAA